MEEYGSWKLFETTGAVKDYLNYRMAQENIEENKGKDSNECRQSGGNIFAGADSSQQSTGGI